MLCGLLYHTVKFVMALSDRAPASHLVEASRIFLRQPELIDRPAISPGGHARVGLRRPFVFNTSLIFAGLILPPDGI